MGIESVRGNIIKQVKKSQEDVTETANLKGEVKKIMEIAEAFATDGEYAYSFFMYYRALKLVAMLKVKEKTKDIGGLGEGDALIFLAQKGMLGMDQKSLDSIKETVEKILVREKIDKTEFQKISKVIAALKNEI